MEMIGTALTGNEREVTGMADIEKVKHGLKAHTNECAWACNENCPYYEPSEYGCCDNLIKDALSVIEELQAEIERIQPKWISVSERMPEDESDIIVYCDDGEESRIVACNYDNGVWFDCVFNTVMVFKNITHWMPLPKPPKKDGDGDE